MSDELGAFRFEPLNFAKFNALKLVFYMETYYFAANLTFAAEKG
jgi:hypothetical protein